MLSVDQIKKLLTKPSKKTKSFTSDDFAKALGVHLYTARIKMRQLFKDGKIVQDGSRVASRLDGQQYQCPVYRFVDIKKPKAKK